MTNEQNQNKNRDQDMRTPQPRLGRGGMIALITMCNAIAPLSTDMYMPALPDMAVYFDTTDSIMNMTLIGFFLFFAMIGKTSIYYTIMALWRHH